MARSHQTKHLSSREGLAELETLVLELSKPQPDVKMVQNITKQYGIPFESDSISQIDQVLTFLNSNRFVRLPNLEE